MLGFFYMALCVCEW